MTTVQCGATFGVHYTPQLELWELDDDQWRKVLERSGWQHLKRPGVEARLQQLPLPMPTTELAS